MSKFTENTDFDWQAMPFAALIGDVRNSRDIEDRADFQAQLESVLGGLSHEIGPSGLVTPLQLTAGDELQEVFHDYGAILDVIVRLSEEFFPIRIAYGLGFGELTVPPGPKVALMDGPCFHLAREALGRAQKLDGWLSADGLGEAEDRMLEAHLNLVDGIRSGWTAKQAAYAYAVRDRSQKEVAMDFGVSPSVVSESLKSAQATKVRAAEEASRRWLEEFCYLTELGLDSCFKPNFESASHLDPGQGESE